MKPYKKEANERWGKTEAWSEYEKKASSHSSAERKTATDGLTAIY